MTINTILTITGTLLLCMVLGSCGRDMCCDIPPNHGSLYLSLKHNGTPLPDSILDKVILRYASNGMLFTDPNHDPDKPGSFQYDGHFLLKRAEDGTGNLIPGVVISSIVPEIIARSNIQDFYLCYPDGSTDTLHIAMEQVTEEQLELERCKCIYPFRSITYRGITAGEDASVYTGIFDTPVFLIEK